MTPLKLSRRFPSEMSSNPLHRLLEEKRASRAEIFDLTAANPTAVGLEAPPEALQALSDPRGAVYEPEPRGLGAARRAVAEYYGDRGITLDPDQVVLAAGTSEAYGFLFKLLADPGSSVLVPSPSYPLFGHLAAMESVSTVPYGLAADSWRIDPESLERAGEEAADPRAVVVVCPNNPTGSFLSHHDLACLATFCRGRGLPLIADEVFGDYAFHPDPDRVSSVLAEPLEGVPRFVLSGFSKMCALPQFKMAWIATDAGPETLERLDLVADTYLSVATSVQWAARRLFTLREERQRAVRNRLNENLAHLMESTKAPGVRVLPPEGGWYAVLDLGSGASEETIVLDLLAEKNVYVHPGYFFDFEREGFLVVSLLPRPAAFAAGIERLLAAVT